MDAVSPILVDRAREPQGLRMTVVVSLVVHGVVALILLFGPPLVPVDTTPHTVMTISLGGATGARTGGATQMAGAATQKAEPDTKPSPAPPAVAKPEMVLPKTAKAGRRQRRRRRSCRTRSPERCRSAAKPRRVMRGSRPRRTRRVSGCPAAAPALAGTSTSRTSAARST